MARFWFGRQAADYVAFRGSGRPDPAVAVTFWSLEVGGSQYTDLLIGGVGATQATTDSDGRPPQLQGPDGVTQMWADAGAGVRTLMISTDVALLLTSGGGGGSSVIDGGTPSSSGSGTSIDGGAP